MNLVSTASLTPLTSTLLADLLTDTELVSSLTQMGIVTATPVQSAALPAILAGHDLVVQAQTGSGKTLAFALPLISALRHTSKKSGTIALILTPTRELALQVRNVFAEVAPDIHPACVIGGANVKQQVKEIQEDPRIIVGTPGRVMDLIEQNEITLKKCKHFVLDEADEMLSMGFLESVKAILLKLPKPRQGLFFSATITPRVKSLGYSFLKDPQTIVIESTQETANDIEHLFCRVDGGLASKAKAVCTIIETEKPRLAVIFCNTKSDTELVEVFLRRRGFDARRINSDLSQKQRDSIMKDIRSESLQILIATDVAARGIDIDHLDLVINYTIHDQAETYVHRTGRTGRAGRSGKAVSIVAPGDFATWHRLTKALPFELKEIELPPSDL